MRISKLDTSTTHDYAAPMSRLREESLPSLTGTAAMLREFREPVTRLRAIVLRLSRAELLAVYGEVSSPPAPRR